ncbi:MAG TPA: anti-sigma factor [Acidimicrobiales bacterium]|nr:anti-sigma factor [Acidimicrobiales bacterium]
MPLEPTEADPPSPLLDDPATWAEVSPGLRARTLAAATAAAPAIAVLSARRRRRRPFVLAAAAAIVVAVAVAGGVRLTMDRRPDPTELELAGTDAAPDATASAYLRDEAAGVSIDLDVDGLPPAPDGMFYEAWLVGDTGKISAGTFHVREGPGKVTLWLGVDPAGYDALSVTLQPVEGGSLAEGVVVLRGELD